MIVTECGRRNIFSIERNILFATKKGNLQIFIRYCETFFK